ncbi:MAG: hypothetical protein U9M97_03925 [Candidatus Hadarchaeota archaeon]|nr:hypothetical protein [Candidatus Hadarchaeota archaeon]
MKRGGLSSPLDSRLRRDLGGNMPEETDIRLLAECIKLNDLCIPRIWRISLFSDDADFKRFSDEIEGEFNIRVY